MDEKNNTDKEISQEQKISSPSQDEQTVDTDFAEQAKQAQGDSQEEIPPPPPKSPTQKMGLAQKAIEQTYRVVARRCWAPPNWLG